jgi:hypothetical protein
MLCHDTFKGLKTIPWQAGNGVEPPAAISMSQRWYSMGPIRVADFNADGVVDGRDLQKAHDTIAYAIANPTEVPIKVFATGDINRDGVINALDEIEFDYYWYYYPNEIVAFGEAKEL